MSALDNEEVLPKILLLEDSEPFAKAISMKLQKELGWQVVIAKSFAELIATVPDCEHDFFVGVFDYYLPDSSSGEAIDYAIANSLPVIVLTSAYDDDIRETLAQKEIIDYVLKRNIEDIDYLVSLIRQLRRNMDTKVLIVDDSSLYRALLKELLTTQMYNVYEAKDGAIALQVMEEQKDISIVLTDYFMPNMDGFELVTRLRKLYSKEELAIIAISSDSSQELVSRFLKFGANDYIKKPFSKEEFVCRVNNNAEHLHLVKFQKTLSNTDYLTDLYNRKYFMETGQIMYENSVRGNISFIIGMFDIDNFKQINDRYGHAVGDLVIKDFADCLRACFRTSDVICRFGGEEFCVMLTEVEDAYVEHTFNKLMQTVHSREIVTKNKNVVSYTVSAGVCATLMSSLDAMLKVADDKLYEAKKAGKNRVITDIEPH
jgi:diguanylate cyclase (GGDEF)-like protein